MQLHLNQQSRRSDGCLHSTGPFDPHLHQMEQRVLRSALDALDPSLLMAIVSPSDRATGARLAQPTRARTSPPRHADTNTGPHLTTAMVPHGGRASNYPLGLGEK